MLALGSPCWLPSMAWRMSSLWSFGISVITFQTERLIPKPRMDIVDSRDHIDHFLLTLPLISPTGDKEAGDVKRNPRVQHDVPQQPGETAIKIRASAIKSRVMCFEPAMVSEEGCGERISSWTPTRSFPRPPVVASDAKSLRSCRSVELKK